MYKARLYPTKAQAAKLSFLLHVTRDLYNAALQQQRDVWLMRRKSVKYKKQYAELTELRRESPRLASVYRELEDAVLHRLDLARAAFFRRKKRGKVPGFPRFRAASRWTQLEFPHGGRALKLDARQKRVRIPGVGTVRMRKGRAIPEFGRAFLVRKNERWSVVFECEREPEPLPPTGQMIGLDRGVRLLVDTSDGERLKNPRHVEQRQALVERHQQDLERRTERDARGRVTNGSDPKRRSAVVRLARAKEREKNARRDALHKLSRRLVARYDLLAVENLRVRNMLRSAKGTIEKPGRGVRAKARLNRKIADAGWSTLVTLIREKAAWAARSVVEVPAKNTSRTCAECGHVSAQSRKGARFCCVGCGHEADADVNAARVILARAKSSLAISALSLGDARLARQDATRGCT